MQRFPGTAKSGDKTPDDLFPAKAEVAFHSPFDHRKIVRVECPDGLQTSELNSAGRAARDLVRACLGEGVQFGDLYRAHGPNTLGLAVVIVLKSCGDQTPDTRQACTAFASAFVIVQHILRVIDEDSPLHKSELRELVVENFSQTPRGFEALIEEAIRQLRVLADFYDKRLARRLERIVACTLRLLDGENEKRSPSKANTAYEYAGSDTEAQLGRHLEQQLALDTGRKRRFRPLVTQDQELTSFTLSMRNESLAPRAAKDTRNCESGESDDLSAILDE